MTSFAPKKPAPQDRLQTPTIAHALRPRGCQHHIRRRGSGQLTREPRRVYRAGSKTARQWPARTTGITIGFAVQQYSRSAAAVCPILSAAAPTTLSSRKYQNTGDVRGHGSSKNLEPRSQVTLLSSRHRCLQCYYSCAVAVIEGWDPLSLGQADKE